jgi:MFS transporter, UMF1 family
MQSHLFRRPVFAWALYDWANSAYATTVIAAFFPVFYKQTLAAELPAAESTLWLGVANTIASFLVAIFAPWLGALADKSRAHIKLLVVFTMLGVVPTALLAFLSAGDWQIGLLWYGISAVGFWGGLIFYDSMLIQVAPAERLDSVSGFGYAFGYVGGGVLLVVNVTMYLKPEVFGLASKDAAVSVMFLTVAVWWLVFAMPLFRQGVQYRMPGQGLGAVAAMRAGFVELVRTFREIRKLKPVILFLCAYWLYIDGVNTAIKMAVDFGLALNFSANSLITAILLIQFIGFPATWLFGHFADRIGPLLGIFVSIGVYCAVTLYAYWMTSVREFYVLAIAIGCVQGAVQSLSRSYFAKLIPPGKAGEFFGFYNMMGKFASVLGPVLMGATAVMTGSSRLSILALLLLFVSGAILLAIAVRSGAPARR